MRIEILAGVTTFITIAYILILNPQILADPYMIMGDGAMAEKNFKWCIYRNLYRRIYWYDFMFVICKGSICPGAWYGTECIFCIYGCAWEWDIPTMRRL